MKLSDARLCQNCHCVDSNRECNQCPDCADPCRINLYQALNPNQKLQGLLKDQGLFGDRKIYIDKSGDRVKEY